MTQHTIYINQELEELFERFREEHGLNFNKAVGVILMRGFKNPSISQYADSLKAIDFYRKKYEEFTVVREKVKKI